MEAPPSKASAPVSSEASINLNPESSGGDEDSKKSFKWGAFLDFKLKVNHA